MKKYTKPLIALILVASMLSSVYVGTSLAFISNPLSPGGADYVSFEGVAANDYFDSRQYSYQVNQWADEINVTGQNFQNATIQYPVVNPANQWFTAAKSLRTGITEFGEFATAGFTGVAYGANGAEWANTESWASQFINPQYYIQGWVFYMNYTRVGILRAIEGYAIYSDTATIEGGRKVYSWDGTKNPAASGTGLTLGSLATSGVQVLYDSARLAVGRTSIIIHDNVYNEDVAKVTLTVVFNKDGKYAIIYKDVKILLDTKVLDTINDFAFSERYEIDLARGINPSNQAYIHYFHNYNTTVYQHPLTGSNLYDVVQAFNANRNYTFFAAYWPNTTEHTVYNPLVPDLPNGFTRVLGKEGSLTDVDDIPGPTGEPSTPWVIAQWRYQQGYGAGVKNYFPNMLHFLAKDPNREIRFVEVFGMTDYNMGTEAYAPFRALDQNASDPVNQVDVEVRYMLNNVFNPEDLKSTVYNQPFFMWTAVGTNAQSADNIGAAQLQGIKTNASLYWVDYQDAIPLGLLDKNDSANKGSIPWGMSNSGNFVNYFESFTNVAKGTGIDSTIFLRTGFNGFAFQFYDAATTARTPNQPIAGGFSTPIKYWFPSKDPLSERWSVGSGSLNATGTYTLSPNDGNGGAFLTHPNGILTVGGGKANQVTRYFNDMNFALQREGTAFLANQNGAVVTGSAPTSNPALPTFDFFPVSTWNTATPTSPNVPVTSTGYSNPLDNSAGYAILAVARDINGTRGLSVAGWDARDTYWACAWAAQTLNGNVTMFDNLFPAGTVAFILKISYISVNNEPTGTPSGFTIVKALGTITEFGSNRFATAYGYDLITGPTFWTGLVATPITWNGGSWWYQKINYSSTASVDFDS